MTYSLDAQLVLGELKKHGLLLQSDASLPNVCALVAGEPVRGSWWSHPRSHAIFRVNGELEDHPDVLVSKLVSGKITYLHRPLWPALIAIGRAREPWQMARLPRGARDLLREVDGNPVQTDRRSSKAGSELEIRLLVYVEQFHTESGAHARRLESWDHWSSRTGYQGKPIAVDRAKQALADTIGSLNREFKGRGRLPWRP